MKHCLVVDDSHVIRKVARRILEKLQFQVSEAESGEQALELCKTRMPDVILVDWHMPTMSGFEVLLSLRALPDGKKPIAIYCTTENDPTDIARALSAGADDCLLKPFDRQSIQAKLAATGLTQTRST
jgi:two-component system chemotaxis response regulator CheY